MNLDDLRIDIITLLHEGDTKFYQTFVMSFLDDNLNSLVSITMKRYGRKSVLKVGGKLEYEKIIVRDRLFTNPFHECSLSMDDISARKMLRGYYIWDNILMDHKTERSKKIDFLFDSGVISTTSSTSPTGEINTRVKLVNTFFKTVGIINVKDLHDFLRLDMDMRLCIENTEVKSAIRESKSRSWGSW